MQFISELPSEIINKPKPLIGIYGLDVEENKTHKIIWKTFSLNRNNDRPPLKFMLLNKKLPPSKQKQANHYEFNLAKGILKFNWLKKHSLEIPSVVVVFIELDFDDSQWNKKLEECQEKIKAAEFLISERPINLAVVLLQSKALFPPNEDILSREKARSFCLKSGISSEYLFSLPKDDIVPAYVIRLETEFLNISNNYYSKKIKVIRSYKNDVNRSAHNAYLIRHEFKIAVFNEFRQDPKSALKAYKQAYNYILETRNSDSNLLENKTIAAFINYKICKFAFSTSASDAIKQFRTHIDFFVEQVGIKELRFEHETWLSKQFETFGNLFSDVMKPNFNSLLTHNPGWYYQEAARYEIKRREFVQNHLSNLPENEFSPEFINEMENYVPEYFGQRPWKKSKRSTEPNEINREKMALNYLKSNESKIEHWKNIIGFFEKACEQFSRHKAVRIRLFLLFQISLEYINLSMFDKAQRNLETILDHFYSENWAPIYSQIVQYLFLCNKALGDKPKLLINSMEILADCLIDEKTKNEAFNQVKKIFKPEDKYIQKMPCDFSRIKSFLQCKAVFLSKSVKLDEPIRFILFFKSDFKDSIKIKDINVSIDYKSNKISNEPNKMSENSKSLYESNELSTQCQYPLPIEFNSDNLTMVGLLMNLNKVTVNKLAQIKSVSFSLILSEEINEIACIWKFPNSQSHQEPSFCWLPKENNDNAVLVELPHDWQFIHNRTSVEILNKDPRVSFDVTHPKQAMIDERFPMTCQLKNEEDFLINQLEYSFRITEVNSYMDSLERSKALETSKVASANLEFRSIIDHSFNEEYILESGQILDQTIYGLCTTLGLRDLHFTLQYTLPTFRLNHRKIYLLKINNSNERLTQMKYEILNELDDDDCENSTINDIKCTFIKTIRIDVGETFEIDSSLLTLQYDDLTNLIINDSFVMKVNTINTSESLIRITKATFELNEHIKTEDLQLVSPITNNNSMTLDKNESLTDIRVLFVDKSAFAGEQIAMGFYRIQWIRASSEDGRFDKMFVTNETVISLGRSVVHASPLSVTADLPSFSYEDELIYIRYSLLNTTIYPQDINIVITKTVDFNFAGLCNTNMCLFPNVPKEFSIRAYPLKTGNLELPKIEIKFIDELFQMGLPMDKLLQNVPSHLFILPKGRHSSKVQT